MPCLSSRFDPEIGPLISIGIVPTGFELAPSSGTAPKIEKFPALIDTGANITCVSPNVVASVGLQPIGKRPCTSATHTVHANLYIVDIIIPFGALSYVIRASQVIEFSPSGDSPFQILLGRDIICQGAFTVSFDGHFVFSL